MGSKLTYRDISGKLHKTKGVFIGWTPPTGLLGVPYAIIQRPRSELFIPVYLLTQETKSQIANLERVEL